MKLNRLAKQRSKHGNISRIPMTVQSYNLSHTKSNSIHQVPKDSVLKQKHNKTESAGPIRCAHPSQDLAKELENQLSQQIKRDNSIAPYKSTLSSIIQNEKTFGKVLVKLQDFYNGQVNSLQKPALIKLREQLGEEIEEFKAKIDLEKQEISDMKKRTEKYSKENKDLVNTVKEKEEKLGDMKDQLEQITGQDISYFPHNSETWEAIKDQIKELSDTCKHMKKEYKETRSSEKKLVKLVLALKKRGIPVEEVYEADVQNKKEKKKRKKKSYVCVDEPNDDYQEEDNTERQPLVEGPPARVEKPHFVPALPVEENFYESSESYDSDGKSQTEQSEPANHAYRF